MCQRETFKKDPKSWVQKNKSVKEKVVVVVGDLDVQKVFQVNLNE